MSDQNLEQRVSTLEIRVAVLEEQVQAQPDADYFMKEAKLLLRNRKHGRSGPSDRN